jgi:hypothetical protein
MNGPPRAGHFALTQPRGRRRGISVWVRPARYPPIPSTSRRHDGPGGETHLIAGRHPFDAAAHRRSERAVGTISDGQAAGIAQPTAPASGWPQLCIHRQSAG